MSIELNGRILRYRSDILDFGFSYTLPENKPSKRELQSDAEREDKLKKRQDRNENEKHSKNKPIKILNRVGSIVIYVLYN